jgi:hypothetical protein
MNRTVKIAVVVAAIVPVAGFGVAASAAVNAGPRAEGATSLGVAAIPLPVGAARVVDADQPLQRWMTDDA